MPQFQHESISLEHPGDWTVEVQTTACEQDHGDDEEHDHGWNINLQSSETAFIVIDFCPEADDNALLADATLTALKEEFPELDADDRMETIAGRMAIGHDIDLIALDATVTCQTRCFETPGGPILVMTQYSERDSDDTKAAALAILKSLTIIDD